MTEAEEGDSRAGCPRNVRVLSRSSRSPRPGTRRRSPSPRRGRRPSGGTRSAPGPEARERASSSLCSIAPSAPASTKDAIAERLGEARERTLLLVEQLDDEQLNTVYSPLLSPLAWDLGHIANFEELWLVQRPAAASPSTASSVASTTRSRTRGPGATSCRSCAATSCAAYMAEVRERALDVLEERRRRGRRRGSPPARRIRLRDADRARASAQRDDAPAPADGRRLRAADLGGRRPSRSEPTAGDGRGPGRHPRDRSSATAASPTTTSAPATRSSSRRS